MLRCSETRTVTSLHSLSCVTMGEETTTDKVADAVVDSLNPSATADELWRILAGTMSVTTPHTVARVGRLCRFGVVEEGGPRDGRMERLELREHDIDTLRDKITRHVRPVKGQYVAGVWNIETDEDGHRKPARIPNEALSALIKRPLDVLDEIAEVPRVDRIVDVPVFGPQGELALKPGYHPDARIFYKGLTVPEVTAEWDDIEMRLSDVEWARHLLLDEMLGDFPFADQASRAHALGLVVEQFARGMIDGPAPAYVVIAAEQGTGKSLMAQACLYPSCGRIDLSPEPEPTPQDFQKRLLSELIRGPQAIVFDNVTRRLEDSALAAMLTSGRYADRVLGKSQILSFPVRHTTVFTMNNPEIGQDMRRRVVPIYLDAGVERPWERSGPPGRQWQHPNLLHWTETERARLARAAITLIQHYVTGWEGRVEAPGRLMGSFEEWSRIIGGIVTAAGVPGFGGNLDRMFAEQADADAEWGEFLVAWPEGQKLTATEIVTMVTVGFAGQMPVLPPTALQDRRGSVNFKSVSYGMRQMRGRVRDGLRLQNDRSARPTVWYVEGATL